MQLIKFKWKHWLLLLTVLMMSTLVVGCAAEEIAEKPVIKFGDNMYESIWINNAIATFIIEKGYGYPVETIVMSTSIAQVSLSKGDIHVWMEIWKQNVIEWHDKEIAAGNIENGGLVFEGGPQFFLIPKWVAEEYNIKTIFDMKEHWELVKDPEDPSKGAFTNSCIGWECTKINIVKLEAYGLTDYYNIISTGSAGAQEAALAGAQKKHNPVFSYYFAPTSIMGMYDWYILEEPEYDEEIWAQIKAAVDDETLRPLDEACAYETLPVDKFFHKSLKEIAPDVREMLMKMMVGVDPLNKTAALAKETEIAGVWEKAAVWYLSEYDNVWKTWVTTDAYDKIKAALAGL